MSARQKVATTAKVTRATARGVGKVMNQCLRLTCLHNGSNPPDPKCRCCQQGHPTRLK